MLSSRRNFAVGIPIILGLLLTALEAAVACTPPPPANPDPSAPPPCDCGCCPGDGSQGPGDNRDRIGGMVIGHTGALYESATDLTVSSVGPQYHMTRTYTNRFDDNPAGNYKGDLGWNWTSRDLMRLAVEETGTPNPASIRVCYETTFERVFSKTGDSPLKYSGGTENQDLFDVIEQETIGSTTYWRLTKCCGRKFYFYPFTAGQKSGRLAMEKDAIGNTLTYTYGADNKPAYVTDMVGNTVYCTYYSAGDARDGLLKTVQWKYAGTVRQTVYYAYDDQQNLCRATVEVDDVLHTNQKACRTWLYVYAKGMGDAQLDHNLLYVVAPQQYQQMQDDHVVTLQPGTHYLEDEVVTDGSVVYDPDGTTLTWSNYASRRYQYGTSGVEKDRVTSEVAANGETLTFGYSTDFSGLPGNLSNDSTLAMVVTVTYADQFTDKHVVDNLGRLRCEIRSDGTVTETTLRELDADGKGRVAAITYPDGRKLRYIYQTGYNPDNDTTSGNDTDYPAFTVVEYVDGGQTQRRVLSQATYGVTGFPALPLTRVTYNSGTNSDLSGTEGVDKFTTDYCYNTDGTVKYEVQPLIKSGWLPSAQSAADYRLGVEYTYTSAGQVEYEKPFICDAYTPGNPPSFTNKVQQTQSKREYYASGASQGLLQYVTVDEGSGKLNLKIEHQYDDWRNPSKTIVDPGTSPHLAITTEYTYDPAGALLTTKSPGGYYTENTYNLSGSLTQVDRYQDNTKAVQLAKTAYIYDLYGRVTNTQRYWDASNHAESYTTYDDRGRVDSQVDPPDAQSYRHGRQFTYDKWGHVTQTAIGGVWSGVETGSWLTSPDVVAKTTIATNYYTEGLTDSTKDGYDDNVVQNTYDKRARLLTATHKKSDANYNGGQIPSGTLRTTLKVDYTYDNRGLATKIENKSNSDAKFNESTTAYDGMGRPTERTVGDGNGHSLSTKYDYDELGRVWRVTDPSNNQTVTQYDAAGRTTQTTDGDGNIAVTQYDAAGRVAKTIRKDHKPGAGTDNDDYLWYVTSFSYDNEGRIEQVDDEGEDTDYNGSGNATHLVTYYYYGESAYQTVTAVKDSLGHYARSEHDGLGRRIWRREGGTGTFPSESYLAATRFDYDAAGRLTQMVSGGPDGVVGTGSDQATLYTYTKHGLLDTTTYPDNGAVSNVYYARNDALDTVTDQKSVVTKYEYKAVAVGSDYNVETRQYVSSGTPDGGDQEVVTTADGLGRVASVVTNDTHASGTQTSKLTNAYKFCGALWKQDQQLGDGSGDVRTVEYGFDATCGRVNKLYWPYASSAGDYVAYSDFDGLNRPLTIANNIGGNATTIVTYKFLGQRPAEKEYPQGTPSYTVRQTFWSDSENNYDSYGRLARSHAVRNPGGQAAEVLDLRYQYDAVGNPTWRYDVLQNSGSTKWSQTYEYDVRNQLTKALQGERDGTWPSAPTMTSADKTWVWNGSEGGNTYTLDKMGNWAKFYNNAVVDERTHNAVNEVETRTVGGTSQDPTHDADGNLTDDAVNYKYVYDFRNRLVQVKRHGNNSLKAACSYDGLNRRIRKIVYQSNGTTEDSDTRYLYDGQRVIEERNENDSHKLLARYIYGTLYIDEPVRMYRDGNGDGAFDNVADVNVYYLQDRLFNVVALTGTDGVVKERTWYECYGKPTNRRASDDDETLASHFGNPYLFTGRELDSETGLYNYRARYYSAELGRFLGRDPIESDLNLYRYVGNNPVNATDYDGLIKYSMTPGSTIRNAKCGTRFSAHWKISLDKPAPSDGYFIQHIREWDAGAKCNGLDCDAHLPLDVEKSRKPDEEFWEVLPPPVRKTKTENVHQMGLGFTDAFSFTAVKNTCRETLMVWEVRFYSVKATGGIIDKKRWPGGSKQTKDTPSTLTEPGFWKDKPIEEPVTQRMYLSWCCCKDGGGFVEWDWIGD